MNIIIKLLEKFIGKRSELSLENRFFNILALMGIAFAIYASILNYLLKLNIVAVIAPIIMSFISIILYRHALKTKKYNITTNIFLSFAALIFYPFMWIVNGGSKGAIPLFLVLHAGMIAVFLSRMKKKIILWMFVIAVCSLIIIEFLYPDIIIDYNSDLTRFLDIGVSLPLVSFGIFILISTIMREYNYNIDELKKIQKKLEQVNGKLEKASITDELSGIFNRRYIMEKLNKEVLNNNNNVSVIMLDIDHFKKVNDTYGHSVGDKVIQKVSTILQENTRSTDVLGRIGGEEFLILLPGADITSAMQRAETIRRIVSELTLDIIDIKITISGGVYCKKDNESIEDVLEYVDKFLYKAKESGRNCIITNNYQR